MLMSWHSKHTSKDFVALLLRTYTYGSSLNWISSDFPIPLAFPRHSRQTVISSQLQTLANGRYLAPEHTINPATRPSKSLKELSYSHSLMVRSIVFRERWRCLRTR